MWPLAHHLALVLAVAAMAAAALRIASRFTPRGLDRVLAAAAAGCSLAVLEALALGIVGLGASTIALTIAALTTGLAALLLLPAPSPGLAGDLAGWWAGLGRRGQIAACAAAAVLASWAVWIFHSPPVGFDASLYQYVEIARWIHSGTPGAIENVSYEFPVGNYPLATDVLLAWGAGISRSFVWVTFLPFATFALLGAASWRVTQRLRAPLVIGALAVSAILTVPGLVSEVAEPDTDLPALAWLAVTAALALGVRERVTMIAPALLAGGLAIGTKPTVAPLVVVALIAGVRPAGRRLPWRDVGAAAACAAAVGGLWYARNLVEHGTPFWPFAPGPFGDPTPRWLAAVDTTFLDRPLATIREVPAREYAKAIGASALLLPAAALAPLVTRRRDVLVGALLTGAALLLWMNAPATGVPEAPGVWRPWAWPPSTARYVLPVFAMACVTLLLVARAGGWPSLGAGCVLGAVAAGNLVVIAAVGEPWLPPVQLVIAAALGGLAGALATRVRSRPRRAPLPHAARAGAALALAIALAGASSVAANGYVERHARARQSTAMGRGVVGWLESRPGFANSDAPVAVTSRAMIGPLAGDRLTHPLDLIPREEPCTRVLARRGWVVASAPTFARGFLGIEPLTSSSCLRGRRRLFSDGNFDVYYLR